MMLRAPLVVAADGRRSLCRAAAGIAIDERDYKQVALTVCLDAHAAASRHLDRISHAKRAVHLGAAAGSALEPGLGARSAEADDIAALDDAELSAEIERALAFDPRQDRGRTRPRRCSRCRSPPRTRFADSRIALVGEAAHVIPPIGAQGLNLGLRDAATIGELAIAAHRDGRDIGGDDVLAAYDKMRRADVGSRTLAIDLLNRTLLTDFLPVQGVRGLGLYMIDRIGPLAPRA